jgi:hypothetical protein
MTDYGMILLEKVFPEGLLKHFEITGVRDLATEGSPTLEVTVREKNVLPPLPKELQGRKIQSRGFKSKTLQDFPIRGQRVYLKIEYRRWKVEGVESLLVRELEIKEDGTQVVAEFANFLKELGRTSTDRNFDRRWFL